MSLFPEKEPRKKESYESIPEDVGPLEIEKKEVVQPVPTQFTKQVYDDKGNPVIQTSQNKVVTINLPKTEETFRDEAKGEVEESSTWNARWWIRVIQKAYRFGWEIISKPLTRKDTN